MSQKKAKGKPRTVKGGTGITAGRDITLGNISGQFALGNDNRQIMTKTKNVYVKKAPKLPPAPPSVINVLFLAANPAGTTQLDLNKEFNAIEDELENSKFRDRFNLEQRFELTADDISRRLLMYDPHIVHFSGHGSQAGEIILQEANGEPHPVDAKAITNLFSILRDNIRCVILNACYTKLQATLISKHIDCVIGMSKAIGDEAAIKFAQGFYRGIGYGKDLETAFKLGCAQIDLKGLDEEGTPKIIWKNNEPKKIVLV
jgi:hypothetical protein